MQILLLKKLQNYINTSFPPKFVEGLGLCVNYKYLKPTEVSIVYFDDEIKYKFLAYMVGGEEIGTYKTFKQVLELTVGLEEK